MIVRENVPLAGLTTLRVGGPARFVLELECEEDLPEAIAFASEKQLPLRILGSGSNVLADDTGYSGVLALFRMDSIELADEGDSVLVSAGAGVPWDTLVRYAGEQNLWGIENLAGIPGTTGAAPVQNIGAYGMEVADTIQSVRVFNADTKEIRAYTNKECLFGYRESIFKQDRTLYILSVTFRLARNGSPSLAYKDLQTRVDEGADLSTPERIGEEVRMIRAQKFPDLRTQGTAGSFFKNPTVTPEQYATLQEKYPSIPGFPNDEGIKIPLAFVLDHVLGLRGHKDGALRLFESQPLVLVTEEGAIASDVDAFATTIAEKVFAATNIRVEREVQTLK